MKETNLNTIWNEVETYLDNYGTPLLEVIQRSDLVNWFVIAYNTNDRVKVCSVRLNANNDYDYTIITTRQAISIIDNQSGKSSWAKAAQELCRYNVLEDDIMMLSCVLDFVWQRLLISAH